MPQSSMRCRITASSPAELAELDRGDDAGERSIFTDGRPTRVMADSYGGYVVSGDVRLASGRVVGVTVDGVRLDGFGEVCDAGVVIMVNVPCRQTVPPMEVADIAEAGGAVVHDAAHYRMFRAVPDVLAAA